MEVYQNNREQKELYELAQKRVKKIKDFYIHLFIYAIGIIFYILKTYFGVSFNFFPLRHINFFVMAFWTFIIVVQAFGLFFTEVFFGKKWEDKNIKRIIEKESKKQTWQ